MGQRCCKGLPFAKKAQRAKAAIQTTARATTSPLAPEPKLSAPHPHRSMAGDLITTTRARKLDIREAAIEDYVHL